MRVCDLDALFLEGQQAQVSPTRPSIALALAAPLAIASRRIVLGSRWVLCQTERARDAVEPAQLLGVLELELPNSGMEMDWMSFFYSLDNRTTDAYTIGNFWNVFQTECGVPPIDLCVVSWDSLVTAAESWFGPTHTKALYLSGLGSVHGVDH